MQSLSTAPETLTLRASPIPLPLGSLRPAFQPAYAGEGDAFVAKLNTTGALSYFTYLGGTQADSATGIAVDSTRQCLRDWNDGFHQTSPRPALYFSRPMAAAIPIALWRSLIPRARHWCTQATSAARTRSWQPESLLIRAAPPTLQARLVRTTFPSRIRFRPFPAATATHT